MGYQLLTKLIIGLHFLFLLYVVFGGFLGLALAADDLATSGRCVGCRDRGGSARVPIDRRGELGPDPSR